MTVDEVRNRGFLSGLTAQVKSAIDSVTVGLSKVLKTEVIKVNVENQKECVDQMAGVKKSVDGLSSKTFDVQVKNQLDWSIYLEKINEKLNRATNQLEKIVNLQESDNQESKTEGAGNAQKTVKAVEQVVEVLKQLPSWIKIPNLPEKYKVIGNVTVDNVPKIDLESLKKAIDKVETAISKLQLVVNVPPQKDIVIPAMPKEFKVKEIGGLVDGIAELGKKIDDLPNKMPIADFPESFAINNLKIPQPVTNININPLRGAYLSTNVDVTTSATKMPSSQLVNRRSMIVYNNSSTTIYLGGADVTTTNGLPVPSHSYSPPFDAGERMVLYGISTGTSNTRVLEISNESIGA